MVVDDLESDNSEVRSNKSSLILHKRKAPRFGYGSVEDKNDGELQQTLQTFIRIFELAGPALASLIVEPLMITVDTFYVGRLGKESLAAMAVNTFVFNFSFFIFNFLGGIASPLVAQARAENNKEKEQKVISQLITVALFFGICVVALLLGFSNNILMAMGAEKEIFDAAKTFLQIRALSAPAVLLVHVGHGALRGNLDTRTPLGVIALANLVNFALDPVLIFGLGFGVAGAAATTTISEWIAAILFLVIFKKRLKYSIRPRLKSLVNFFFSGLLGQSSLYVFLRTLFLQAFLTSGGAVAARVSPAAMAAHQVAFQLWLLGSYASDALAVAATALVADAEGRGDRAGGRRAANVGMSIGAVVGGVAGAALCLVGGHRVAALFTPDPDVTQAMKPLTIILGLTQPLNAVVFVSDGVLQGHQQFGLQAGIMSAAVCLSGFLMLYLQKHSFGLLAVWISLCTLQLYRACGFFIYYFTTGNASPSPHQEVETNKEQHKAPQEG